RRPAPPTAPAPHAVATPAAAPHNHDVRQTLRAENPLADESPLPRLVDGDGQAFGGELGLAVYIEDGARGAHDVRGDQRGLEQPVRVAFHEVAILEDPRLALLPLHPQLPPPAAPRPP